MNSGVTCSNIIIHCTTMVAVTVIVTTVIIAIVITIMEIMGFNVLARTSSE